jgi:hypothetical protein
MTTDIAPAWTPTGRTLVENEAIIEQGIEGFIVTGIALTDVRETGQYREEGYGSFSTYLAARWPQLSRAQAYRAIDAAQVDAVLSPVGDTPANEAQARELAPLRAAPDAMRAVWQGVQAAHGGETTAAHVRHAVQEYLGTEVRTDAEATEGPAEPLEGEVEPIRPPRLTDFLLALKDAPLFGLLCYRPQELLPAVVCFGDGDTIRSGVAGIQAWVDVWRQALDS